MPDLVTARVINCSLFTKVHTDKQMRHQLLLWPPRWRRGNSSSRLVIKRSSLAGWEIMSVSPGWGGGGCFSVFFTDTRGPWEHADALKRRWARAACHNEEPFCAHARDACLCMSEHSCPGRIFVLARTQSRTEYRMLYGLFVVWVWGNYCVILNHSRLRFDSLTPVDELRWGIWMRMIIAILVVEQAGALRRSM